MDVVQMDISLDPASAFEHIPVGAPGPLVTSSSSQNFAVATSNFQNIRNEKQDDKANAEWLNKLQSEHSMLFSRNEMNALIMNYLLTEGYQEAAEKFERESGIKIDSTLTETLPVRVDIRQSIHEGNVLESIEKINDSYPDLLDENGDLLFQLQQQHLIELIRSGNVEAALDFAQASLAQRDRECPPEMLNELQQSVSLLAFEDPGKSPFANLMESSHRQKVASQVNAAILETECHEPMSKLSCLVKLLLWTQDHLDKTKTKYPKMTDISSAKVNITCEQVTDNVLVKKQM